MKIQYRLEDMFLSAENVLIHGCNAKGAYASGVAGIMRKKHPFAYEQYRDHHEVHGLFLGEVVWAENKSLIIGNCITQDRYGNDKSTVYCDYDAIRKCMQEVEYKVKDVFSTVGMPMIGAGLANGDWNIIANIIQSEAKSFTPVVYIVDQKIYNTLTK